MAPTITFPVILHADQEHGGIRLVVVILLGAGVLFFFFLLNALLSALSPGGLPDFSFPFTCTAAIVLALAAVWGIEQGLKRVWRSGRSLVLDEAGIQVIDGDLPAFTLSWAGQMRQMYWLFTLQGYKRGGRERRVPEKWLCLALQLQEEEKRVIVHTYLSPKQARALIEKHGRADFHEIFPTQVYPAEGRARYFSIPGRPDKIPATVLAGKDGKYWLAEQRRWQEGFELTAPDFETLISMVISNR